MEACDVHACQGDLFATVPAPVLDVEAAASGWETSSVPALLVTQNCTLDKRSRGGEATVLTLQFLPARRLDKLKDPNREAILRQRDLQPAGPFLIGLAPDGYEYWAHLGEMFSVPAAYFDLSWHKATDDDWRLVTNTQRIGRISEEDLDLLHQKMVAFWTGQRYEPSVAP